jgi:hypothetical protein
VAHSAEEVTPTCPVANLEDASTWPDRIRPLHGRFEYLARMHFEDVPICGAVSKAAYCPDGACITEETRRAIAILRDPRRAPVVPKQSFGGSACRNWSSPLRVHQERRPTDAGFRPAPWRRQA